MSAEDSGQIYAACLGDPETREKQCEYTRCYRTDTETVRIVGGPLPPEDTEIRVCRYHSQDYRGTTS